jgi:hypothetical protein
MIEERIQQAYKRTIPIAPPPPPNGLPKPQPTPIAPQGKPRKRSTKGLPLDYKLWVHISYWMWFTTWKDMYDRVATILKGWTVGSYPRFRTWLTTILSKRVTKEVEEERNRICGLCPLTEDLESCNGATIRNHKSKWFCPAKKHKNEYPVYHELVWGNMATKTCGGCSRNKDKGKEPTNPQ